MLGVIGSSQAASFGALGGIRSLFSLSTLSSSEWVLSAKLNFLLPLSQCSSLSVRWGSPVGLLEWEMGGGRGAVVSGWSGVCWVAVGSLGCCCCV